MKETGDSSKYSPSHPMEDDEEPMDVEEEEDWSSNLTGMAGLFNSQPGSVNNDQTVSGQINVPAVMSAATAAIPDPATSQSDTDAKSVKATKPKKRGGRRQTLEVPPATGESSTTGTGSGGDGAGLQTPEVQPGPTAEQQATFASIAAQSREYVRRFKEKKIGELEEGLGEEQLAYKVINKASIASLSAQDLRHKPEKLPPAELGTFFSEADGRIKLASVKVILGQKKTWSYSFDCNSFECLGCTQHHGRLYFPRRGSGGRGGRQTIWLCDQSMPPIIPVTSSLGCIKIIRLENGSLFDLADGLVELLGGRQVAAGSVVLLSSASNMAAAGTAGYTQDLVAAIHHLRRNLGDHISYGPLPNILFNGSDDENLVRTNLEVGAWAAEAFKDCDALLSSSFKQLEMMMVGRGRGGRQSNYRCRLRLPSSHNSQASYTTWSSGGWEDYPAKLRPPSTSEEKTLYHTIIGELRERHALDLEPEPVIERWPVAVYSREEKKKTFLIVGSSHASRTAEALKRAGFGAELIFKPNWRALKNAIRDLAKELADEINAKLEERKIDAVVLQLLDSNVYWALQEDGSSIAARLGPDKRYHIDGDLITISKSAQHSLFGNLKPIFDCINGKDFLLITPLPRYVAGGCCEDADHMPNRRLPGFEQQLEDDLRATATNFKDFLFTHGYKNGKVVDPAISLRKLQKSEIWGQDPVHPMDKAYDKIAEGVILVATNLEEAGKKRRRTDSFDGGSLRGGRDGHDGQAQQHATSRRQSYNSAYQPRAGHSRRRN
jgi:hypothetical protein